MEVLTRPASEFGNDETLERLWAEKAFDHGHVYFSILRAADPKLLRLTPSDELIYEHFRADFPELAVSSLTDDELKSDAAKSRWRPFCEKFKNLVEDYSFGTLMRADAARGYDSDNVLLVPRIQFYAIEIARNREGVNDRIRELFRPTEEELSAQDTHKEDNT